MRRVRPTEQREGVAWRALRLNYPVLCDWALQSGRGVPRHRFGTDHGADGER